MLKSNLFDQVSDAQNKVLLVTQIGNSIPLQQNKLTRIDAALRKDRDDKAATVAKLRSDLRRVRKEMGEKRRRLKREWEGTLAKVKSKRARRQQEGKKTAATDEAEGGGSNDDDDNDEREKTREDVGGEPGASSAGSKLEVMDRWKNTKLRAILLKVILESNIDWLDDHRIASVMMSLEGGTRIENHFR